MPNGATQPSPFADGDGREQALGAASTQLSPFLSDEPTEATEPAPPEGFAEVDDDQALTEVPAAKPRGRGSRSSAPQ